MKLKLINLLLLLMGLNVSVLGQANDPSDVDSSTTVIPSTTTTKLDCDWLADTSILMSPAYYGQCCNAESVAYLDSVYGRSTWTSIWNTLNKSNYVAELKKNGTCEASTTTSTTEATTTTSEDTTTTVPTSTTPIPTTSAYCTWLIFPMNLTFDNGTEYEYTGECCTKRTWDFLNTNKNYLPSVKTTAQKETLLKYLLRNGGYCDSVTSTTSTTTQSTTTTTSLNCGVLEGTSCCNTTVTSCLTKNWPGWTSVTSTDGYEKELKKCGCDLSSTSTTESSTTVTPESTTSSGFCGVLEGTACCNNSIVGCLNDEYKDWVDWTSIEGNEFALSVCRCELAAKTVEVVDCLTDQFTDQWHRVPEDYVDYLADQCDCVVAGGKWDTPTPKAAGTSHNELWNPGLPTFFGSFEAPSIVKAALSDSF